METQDLLKEISPAIGKAKATGLAKQIIELCYPSADLIDLAFHSDRAIAFRAAWILEIIAEAHPRRFEECAEYFLARYPEQNNQSCRRHFSKILMGLSAAKLGTANLEPIMETTFEWLIDPLSAVAVQANCMEVLLNFKERYDWIEDELFEHTIFLMKTGGPAIQSRGKKTLRQLKKS